MDPTLYPHVLRAVCERPWAILPGTLNTIVDVLRMRAAGERFTGDEISARIAAARAEQGPRQGRQRGNVAVIPIYGVISPRATLFSESSGGTSVEGLRSMFRDALHDEEVDAIVFDVDSPGGQVDGIPELAAEIRAARGTKPILSNANTMAYSAAHWLAAQADEFTVTPSGGVGSIGVLAAHVDQSEHDRMEGFKTTFVHAGKYKVEGNTHEPLGEEARAAVQTDVDAFYAMFTQDLAKARGVPIETVRRDWGEGRTVMAKDALARGMVDRVETLEETIRRAARLATNQARAAAAAGAGPVILSVGTGVTEGEPIGQLNDALLDPDSEALDEGLADGATVDPDADSATALVSGLPLSDRLSLVSEELGATVTHLREHIAMRTREGRSLSQATRDRIERLLAVRPALDEIEAMVRSETPSATAPAPMRRDLALLLLEEATRGGYSIDI